MDVSAKLSLMPDVVAPEAHQNLCSELSGHTYFRFIMQQTTKLSKLGGGRLPGTIQIQFCSLHAELSSMSVMLSAGIKFQLFATSLTLHAYQHATTDQELHAQSTAV